MKKLLIIEDDQVVANIYRNKFALEGYSVEAAADGETGLQLVRTFQPDIVLLDLLLPKMGGVDVIRQIRAEPGSSHLPIVVFSNTYLTNLIQEARAAGATKCLSKANCSPKQVIEIISRMLKSSSREATELDGGVSHASGSATGALAPKQSKATTPQDNTRAFLLSLPSILSNIRLGLTTLVRNPDLEIRRAEAEKLYNQARSLTGGAAAHNLSLIAQMAEAMEALFKELGAKPKNINASTLRTMAIAIDFLAQLVEKPQTGASQKSPRAKVLVVDDETISRHAIVHALAKAKLECIAVDDSKVADAMLQETAFNLVLLDVDMPGLNGFELCTNLRRYQLNRQVPVVFVTSLNDFESRTQSMISGGTDFIGKPFLFVELAVKALVYLLRNRLNSTS